MDTTQIVSTLADTPRWLRAGLAQVTEADAHRAPGAGEWSLAEIMLHLRASDAILAPRVYHVLVRDQPPLIGYDERAWALRAGTARLPIRAQLDLFTGLRLELVGVLRALDDSDWSRSGTHETRGRLTLLEIVTDLANHEVEHRRQWDAARIALGRSGSISPDDAGKRRGPRSSKMPSP